MFVDYQIISDFKSFFGGLKNGAFADLIVIVLWYF